MSLRTAISIFLALICLGCTAPVGKSAKTEVIAGDTKAIYVEIERRSFFDPDGFSRTYKPHVYYSILTHVEQENGLYTYHLNKDFKVGYNEQCEEPGKLTINPTTHTLTVDIAGSEYPCGYFNGSYNLSEADMSFLSVE